MRLRRRYVLLVALLGVATAVLPAIASSETSPSITAHDEPGPYGYGVHSWMPSTATVGSGGAVSFANPSSSTPHGLRFTGGPATPSCAGVPPAASTETGATNWHGECTFSAPGTYTFICTVHPGEMKGTITVNANGTTTTTTTPIPTTSVPTAPVEPASGPPLVGSPTIRSSQRGSAVKGSLEISKAGAGDSLEIDVFAKSAALAKTGHSKRVRVARLVRGSVAAGRLSFAVKLNAKARSALKRHRHLALTVRIALTPSYGEPTTVTRSVVQHP